VGRAAAGRPEAQAAQEGEYVLISGRVHPGGSVELDPFYRVTMLPPRSLNSAGTGPDRLELQAADGRVLVGRDFEAMPAMTHDAVLAASIQQILPWHPDTRSIVVKRAGRVVAQRAVSLNSPVVTLLAPMGGDEWGVEGTAAVSWAAEDADGDILHYWLQYSADGGQTWDTLSKDVAETTFDVDLALVPGSPAAIVRVVATDGVNTAVATSAPFVVARKAPMVSIVAPENGVDRAGRAPMLLEGSAVDWEDGVLPPTALVWASDLDGDLGVGETLSPARLSPGEHLITLTATDSDGQQGVATLQLVVR
jgi:hypothetical protein